MRKLNRNTVPGDKSALAPGGVRIGSPAMTTRGCSEEDFVTIANMLSETVGIAVEIQEKFGKKLVEFQVGIDGHEQILELKTRVEAFATMLPMPGL